MALVVEKPALEDLMASVVEKPELEVLMASVVEKPALEVLIADSGRACWSWTSNVAYLHLPDDSVWTVAQGTPLNAVHAAHESIQKVVGDENQGVERSWILVKAESPVASCLAQQFPTTVAVE